MASPPAPPPTPYGAPYYPAGAPMAPAARPTGVTVIGVLYIVGAVLMFFASMAAFAAGAIFGAAGAGTGEGMLGVIGLLGAAAGIALLVLVGLYAATAYGLFTRKRWAWYVALVMAGIQVISGLLSLIGLDLLGALLNLGIGGFVVWYLLSPHVQAWFGTTVKAPWQYKGNPGF